MNENHKLRLERKMTKEKIIEKIEGYKKLKKGWDGYQAKPVSTENIEAAMKLLADLWDCWGIRNISVGATIEGGVQFEWKYRKFMEIEIVAGEISWLIGENNDYAIVSWSVEGKIYYTDYWQCKNIVRDLVMRSTE